MNLRLAIVSAALTLALPLAAKAAPQLLGVMSSAEPIPMNCESGRCSAELSAFCLEQSRSGPLDGVPYEALDWRGLTLVATAADGSVHSLPAAPYLKVASARGYSAVTASVGEAVRRQLGAVKLALAVGPHVTLVPIARAGDAQPITAQEIAEARATFRPIAGDLFEGSTPPLVTARVLNRLINALPQTAGGEPLDLTHPDGLWDRIVGHGAAAGGAGDAGVAQAALVYESCRRGAHYVQGLTLRRCLEAGHDALMSSLNEEYWRIVGAGS